jgi:ABC-type dipeptide/oligopeptide/nickel transport system permease subunit
VAGNNEGRIKMLKRIPVTCDGSPEFWTCIMKRIASLSILFAALIEFAIERARFDLWIVAVVAIVTLLWNVVARALRSEVNSKKHDDNASTSRG